MKNFNDKLAVLITNAVGTMYSVLYYVYVQSKYRQVLGESRYVGRLLGVDGSKNSRRLWTRELAHQQKVRTISPQGELSFDYGRYTTGISYRPSMQKYFLRKSQSFRASYCLCEQSRSVESLASTKELSGHPLSQGSRIQYSEHLSSQKGWARMSEMPNFICEAISQIKPRQTKAMEAR